MMAFDRWGEKLGPPRTSFLYVTFAPVLGRSVRVVSRRIALSPSRPFAPSS
jgi:hypothetical protein